MSVAAAVSWRNACALAALACLLAGCTGAPAGPSASGGSGERDASPASTGEARPGLSGAVSPPPKKPVVDPPRRQGWRVLSDVPASLNAVEFGDGTGVWTGAEAVFFVGSSVVLVRYEPDRDRWVEGAEPPLGPRYGAHVSQRKGELLVWGGGLKWGNPRGAVYDIASDTWRKTPLLPREVLGNHRASSVRAGDQVIYWGGMRRYVPRAEGWAVDVSSGTATELPPAPIPARFDHTAVWTGREMIVWGGNVDGKGALSGQEGERPLNDGAAYDPKKRSWRVLAASPLTGSAEHGDAVWTGAEMVIFKGKAAAAYDPATDSWRSFDDAPFPYVEGTAAVWADSEVIFLGRHGGSALNPVTKKWRPLPDAPGPAREGGGAVWTGSEMLLLGGYSPRTGVEAADHLAYRP